MYTQGRRRADRGHGEVQPGPATAPRPASGPEVARPCDRAGGKRGAEARRARGSRSDLEAPASRDNILCRAVRECNCRCGHARLTAPFD